MRTPNLFTTALRVGKHGTLTAYVDGGKRCWSMSLFYSGIKDVLQVAADPGLLLAMSGQNFEVSVKKIPSLAPQYIGTCIPAAVQT